MQLYLRSILVSRKGHRTTRHFLPDILLISSRRSLEKEGDYRCADYEELQMVLFLDDMVLVADDAKNLQYSLNSKDAKRGTPNPPKKTKWKRPSEQWKGEWKVSINCNTPQTRVAFWIRIEGYR
uniref:Reverse transcriptase domain-containing protein n=1 Tax=Ascaris lumbricoides TaxID=6252 RepID=A0A0M3IX18_ASCLU